MGPTVSQNLPSAEHRIGSRLQVGPSCVLSQKVNTSLGLAGTLWGGGELCVRHSSRVALTTIKGCFEAGKVGVKARRLGTEH